MFLVLDSKTELNIFKTVIIELLDYSFGYMSRM